MSEEGFLIGVHGIEGPVPISSSSSLDSLPVMDVQSSSSDSSTEYGLSDSMGTGVLISSSNSSLLDVSKQLPQHASQQQLDYHSPMLLPAPVRSTILPAPGPPPANSGRVQHGVGAIHPDSVGSASAPLLVAPASPNPAATTTTVTTHGSAPEFLYQLTKMLSDNTNRDTIEWSNGRIEVHSPHRLETQVLNKYFRHSKVSIHRRPRPSVGIVSANVSRPASVSLCILHEHIGSSRRSNGSSTTLGSESSRGRGRWRRARTSTREPPKILGVCF